MGEHATKGRPRAKLREYLTVGDAATFLGVSPSTLRNWDQLGKVVARRHPVNGYRLYVQAELARLLEQLESSRHGKSRRSQRDRTMRGRR